MDKQIKIIVEKHADGFVAYPMGLRGIVVGQGPTRDAAIADAKSAIEFHIATFGPDVLDLDDLVEDVFVVETGVTM